MNNSWGRLNRGEGRDLSPGVVLGSGVSETSKNFLRLIQDPHIPFPEKGRLNSLGCQLGNSIFIINVLKFLNSLFCLFRENLIKSNRVFPP